MKTLVLTLGLLAACVRAGYAVEYVTLVNQEELQVSPTSLVELMGPSAGVDITFNRQWVQYGAPNSSPTSAVNLAMQPNTPVTGIVNIKFNGSHFATFKITRAEEINATGPTSLLVIPENSTGNYNIVVETSSDTATWTPFHSQTVSANDAKRFFRTRIVKAE
jgi:hypothetical protein